MAWVKCVRAGAAFIIGVSLVSVARAGHEVSYYPSFYPQEIRIEALNPAAAAQAFAGTADPLHAYIGTAPAFPGPAPAQLKSVLSLRSFITASVNPQSARSQSAQARCRAVQEAAQELVQQSDVIVHRYPITPYHADYLSHVDLIGAPAAPAQRGKERTPLTFRAGAGARSLLSPDTPLDAAHWDVDVAEHSVDELLHNAGVGASIWPPPPWAKEGWFQAYQLLRPFLGEQARAERADAIYERLMLGNASEETERLNLQRTLLAALTQGCERAVIGYRLRREYYNDEFSNGVENIASDSQSGLNSAIALRTMKLKDFPWNGWLRVGIDEDKDAAFNPLAGFSDAMGRMVWSMIGDAAFLAIPYNSGWVQNRAEILPEETQKANQSMLVPSGTLMPEAGTGRLLALGPGKGAMGKITYRVAASAFQDGTEVEAADLFYPYALAFRWGGREGSGPVFDPDIAAASRLLCERLAGVRLVRVDERTLAIADLSFNYRSPVVEVYLNNLSADAENNATIAPPWSSVPWHVLALMEASVERNIAAFSQSEAARKGVPWLDLVRDKAQVAKMTELIKEFAQTGYRPAALEGLVSTEVASGRWRALAKFVEENGHLLVTNGPYRLVSWSPKATVLAVVREFTYPVGIGTFDRFAYPPHALITGIEEADNRILLSTDVELALKQQRDHLRVRTPLTRATLRGTLAIAPLPRYLVVGDGGKVVAAGGAKWREDGRFAVTPPPAPAAGSYRLFAGIFLDGNTVDPSVISMKLESK
jgi:hypothetical protein